MSEFKPNTTAYPNFLFEIMHLLCESEIKVLNGIVRKTYGWHKEKDKISLSQMMKLTGLSRQACQDGKDGLVKKGIIKAEIVDGITEYMVIEPDQSKQATSLLGDKPSLLEPKKVVVEVDTQKKELQNKSTKEREETSAHNLEQQPYKIVQQTINRFLLENNMGKCKDDGYNLQAIADLCTTDDIQGEVWDMLMRYKSNEWWWGKMAPQPKQLWKAWDQLLAQPLPDWKRLGYGSEYEYNIKHKTQPSHHTTIQEIAEVQTVKVEPERVESFLDELEEMKK